MADYCYLCGRQVHKDKWREHMLVRHKAVLMEDPKPNGKWKREYKMEEFPKGWQKMKGI